MPNKTMLENYAALAVNVGANVQEGQVAVIRATTETKELARAIAKQAYLAGAKRVHVDWSDDYVSRYGYDHMDIETLQDIPDWIVDKAKYSIEQGACFISITSPIPGLNQGVDPEKMQKSGIAAMKKLSFFQTHMMANKAQWTIVAAPNTIWSEKVFPGKKGEEANEALWDAIFEACRVREGGDAVAEWERHNETLSRRNAILNDHQFASLEFKNSLGTDITIELVDDHVWAGGDEVTTTGVRFNPNIPTEETFTMPHKTGTNGKVVATKPLNYQGNLIEDFWLEFKDGKVVDYDAKKEKRTLQNLLEFDEGSSYLGEIALIEHDSPIQNTGILFYNTLFDENASCHMALGRAYPMNVKNGTSMEQDELIKLGYNHSMAHSDFMFGSEDIDVTGIKKDGTRVPIMRNGNFVL